MFVNFLSRISCLAVNRQNVYDGDVSKYWEVAKAFPSGPIMQYFRLCPCTSLTDFDQPRFASFLFTLQNVKSISRGPFDIQPSLMMNNRGYLSADVQ